MHFSKRSLLQLLLGAQIVRVATLAFPAVGGLLVQTSVALSANHLIAVVLHRQDAERRLNDTTTKSQNQMKGRL